jgi:sulfopyruvate decarboxylase TPP-binding subunit
MTSTSTSPAPVPTVFAQSIPAALLYEQILAQGVSHVLTVPDTHQKSLLALIAEKGTPRLITVCTEDEAIAINAGLYIAGQRPMLLIQNNGVYASVNALKAIAFDAQVPTCLLVGEYGRDVTRPSRENAWRSVRMLEPQFEAWGVPYYRLDRPEDAPLLGTAYGQSWERRGPVAAIVGAPTS